MRICVQWQQVISFKWEEHIWEMTLQIPKWWWKGEIFKVSGGFQSVKGLWLENFGRGIISNINLHMSTTTPFSKLLITKTIWFILKSDYTVPARCPFMAPIWPSDIPSMVPTSNSWLSAFHYLVFTFILKFFLCFIFTRQNKNAE